MIFWRIFRAFHFIKYEVLVQITDLTESVAEITSEKTAGKMEAASESKVAELKKANAALEEENRRLKQQLADTVDYSILEPKREKKKEANAQDSEPGRNGFRNF